MNGTSLARFYLGLDIGTPCPKSDTTRAPSLPEQAEMTPLRTTLPALALLLITPATWAQTPPPAAPPATLDPPPAPLAPPPAAAQPPPAGYAPPPAGYAPPPGYALVPAYSYPVLAPTGPETMPCEDGYPIPDGYHPEKRVRKGLIIAGAVTFGVMYSMSAFSAAKGDGDKALFVPVLGPFIQLGHLDSSPIAPYVGAILVADGVAQTVGVAMLIAGLASKKHVLVRQDVATTTVRITPLTMGYAGAGVGIGLAGEM